MTLPRFDLRAQRRVFQLVRELPPFTMVKVRPSAALPEPAADTQITMRRPTVNSKTLRNPSSLAQPLAPRNGYTSAQVITYCIAMTFFRD